MDGLQHQVKRHAGMLEHGADLHGELLAALAPLFQAVADSAFRVLLARLAENARQIIDTTAADTAIRADNAVRPHDALAVFEREPKRAASGEGVPYGVAHGGRTKF